MYIVIDASKDVEFSTKLKELNKSAFPVAVRQALNSLAFDVKQKTMPATAKGTFVERKANFFKANSKVAMAAGFDINTMSSRVGFHGTSQAVDDLEEQEHGGAIGGRSFVPMDSARIGNSKRKLVKSAARIGNINNLISSKNASGKNRKERFIKSVIHAGRGGIVLSEHKGKMVMWRVNSLKRVNSRKWNLKLTALYSYKHGRDVQVKSTHFMERASVQSAGKVNTFFIESATRQLNRVLKK